MVGSLVDQPTYRFQEFNRWVVMVTAGKDIACPVAAVQQKIAAANRGMVLCPNYLLYHHTTQLVKREWKVLETVLDERSFEGSLQH